MLENFSPMRDTHDFGWTVELNGSLQRGSGVELSPSFEVPRMALVVRRLDFRRISYID
jgi:hypothetical protein